MDQPNTEFAPLEPFVPQLARRRSLLPWWIIGFIWLFFVFAAFVPVIVIMGLLGKTFEISLLGITTYEPLSPAGIGLIVLFAYKGLVSFALWTEKRWAVDVALVDAIISIIVCCGAMGYSMIVLHSLSLRLELIAIIPYLYKMNKLRSTWVHFDDAAEVVPDLPEILPEV